MMQDVHDSRGADDGAFYLTYFNAQTEELRCREIFHRDWTRTFAARPPLGFTGNDLPSRAIVEHSVAALLFYGRYFVLLRGRYLFDPACIDSISTARHRNLERAATVVGGLGPWNICFRKHPPSQRDTVTTLGIQGSARPLVRSWRHLGRLALAETIASSFWGCFRFDLRGVLGRKSTRGLNGRHQFGRARNIWMFIGKSFRLPSAWLQWPKRLHYDPRVPPGGFLLEVGSCARPGKL